MSTEDRSKPPEGMDLESSVSICDGVEECIEAHCEVGYDEDPSHEAAIAAAWAFVDRIRQEAAVAERERIAADMEERADRIAASPEMANLPDNAAIYALAWNWARWLRSGGKGEP